LWVVFWKTLKQKRKKKKKDPGRRGEVDMRGGRPREEGAWRPRDPGNRSLGQGARGKGSGEASHESLGPSTELTKARDYMRRKRRKKKYGGDWWKRDEREPEKRVGGKTTVLLKRHVN